MMSLRVGLYFLFTVCMLSASDFAFDTQHQKVSVAEGAEKIEVLFPFKNASQDLAKIVRYDAPCACIAVQVSGGIKDVKTGSVFFESGGEGVVKAVFKLAAVKGSITKKVLVWTGKDSRERPSIQLTVEVLIPERMIVTPRSLHWQLHGDREAQTVLLRTKGSEPMRIVKCSCSHSQVEYALETIKEGYEYQLRVRPHSTKKVLFAALRLYTDSKYPRYQVEHVFVTVKPKKK